MIAELLIKEVPLCFDGFGAVVAWCDFRQCSLVTITFRHR